jgi:hypothetical protein
MVGTTAGAVVVVAALAAAVIWYAASSSCANSPIAEYLAPSGGIKAVVFERDCGATTGFSTQVSLLSIGRSLPNESGNIFVADHAGGIRVSWRSDAQLRIEHHANARLFKAEPKYENVSVEYVSVK